MKKIWTKVGAAALAGVAVLNAFIPFATATDANSSLTSGATVNESNISEMPETFTLESDVLDFGRITELDRSYTKQIVIKNNSTAEISVDAKAEKYADASEDSAKLSEWIAFVGGVTHFKIASGASANVNVRILVPATATAGSQYANVLITDNNGHSSKVRVKADIAGDNFKYGSEAKDAWVDPVRVDDKINARATVKNTGTAGFTSTYQIKYKNALGGGEMTVLVEESKEVTPGREVSFNSNAQLGFGIYSVEQRVTFVNSEGRMVESLVSRTVINLPWWMLAIAGGVIVLIILIIILAKRRKKHSKKDVARMKKAEREARKKEIEKVERKEQKTIDAEERETADKEDDDTEMGESEIEEIAEQLEKADEVPIDDDAEYDEEEAIPIKVTVKKSHKK